MGRVRAIHADEKKLKKEQILAAARQMLAELSYNEITVQKIAEQVALVKGTVYLYFPAKEALFLEILDGVMGQWLLDLQRRIQELNHLDGDRSKAVQLAEAIVESLRKYPDLPKLMSLFRSVLAHHISAVQLLDYRQVQFRRIQELAGSMVRARFFVHQDLAVRYCYQIYAQILGLWQIGGFQSISPDTTKTAVGSIFSQDFGESLLEGAAILYLGCLGFERPAIQQ